MVRGARIEIARDMTASHASTQLRAIAQPKCANGLRTDLAIRLHQHVHPFQLFAVTLQGHSINEGVQLTYVGKPSRPRILYLTWRDLDHPEAGGAEVFAERTAEELARQGCDVVVFAGGFAGAERETRRNGYLIVRRGRRYSVYLRAMLFMMRNRKRFDAIVDVQNGVPFWAPLFFRGPVFNLTHHVHREQWSSFFIEPVARLGWFLESKVAPFVYRNSRYVTVSEATRTELEGLGISRARIALVYSGNDLPADFDSFAQIARSDAPSLITVGRLVPHKRVELSIAALQRFRFSIPNLELRVVGDGHWLDELKEYARQLNVEDRVHFHGFVEDSEKHELLARSWAMAMPSMKEGWGLTIVEAGAHRTPAIAFRDAGGTQESIQDHETGLLAEDTESFYDAIYRIITDEDFRLKLGENARTFALSFDWRRSGQQLHQLILDALTDEHND